MPKRLITDCSLDDVERVVKIKFGSRSKLKEETPNSRTFDIGRVYRLVAEKHRENHVNLVLKLKTWFIAVLVLSALVLTPALGAGLLLFIILLLYLFLWTPNKLKKLSKDIEDSIRTDQEYMKSAITPEQEVIVARKDVPGERFATKYCIKCGEKIRADAVKCPHCGFMPRE